MTLSLEQVRTCVNITIVQDAILENSESFFVFISSSDPIVEITAGGNAIVTIIDDDGKVLKQVMSMLLKLSVYVHLVAVTVGFALTSLTVVESESVSIPLLFIGETEIPVSVTVSFQPGSASGKKLTVL